MAKQDSPCCVDGIITLKKKPRKRHKFNKVHSAWIDRHGNVYQVENCSHWSWSIEYFSEEGYHPLEKAGWIHLSFDNIYFQPENERIKLTKAQITTLEKWYDQRLGDTGHIALLMKEKPHWF